MGQKSANRKKISKDRRVRNLDPMHQFMPYIMKNRCDAEVYMNETVDVTEALAYVNTKNESNLGYKTTLFHVILAATAKTILHRPYLNRYIAGRRFYERELVSLSFIAKKQFSDKGEESLMIINAGNDTTIDDVGRKVSGSVREVREKGGNELDGLLWVFEKLPRPLLSAIATILNILVFFNRMPQALKAMDPYHTTVFLANLGSIKIGAPYHHLTNYGTNSVMITIGEIHKEYKINERGEAIVRDVAQLGIVIDERIGDGYYFAKSIRLIKHLIANPSLLEMPFGEEVSYE